MEYALLEHQGATPGAPRSHSLAEKSVISGVSAKAVEDYGSLCPCVVPSSFFRSSSLSNTLEMNYLKV